MTIPSWIKNNFGRWIQTPDGRWVDKPNPKELEDTPQPETKEDLELGLKIVLTIIENLVEQQNELRAAVIGLKNLADAQEEVNHAVANSFEALFERLEELEVALEEADIDISSTDRILN